MGYFLSGYAAVFSEPDQARDLIQPGAFQTSLALQKRSLPMLYQHDPLRPIGRWTTLRETKYGLWVEGVLTAGVALAEDVAALIAAQALDGLSIGYRVRSGQAGRGSVRRYLTQLDLVEISIVTFPMQLEARLLLPRIDRLSPAAARGPT
jgi:HK97 family phage prohead protease